MSGEIGCVGKGGPTEEGSMSGENYRNRVGKSWLNRICTVNLLQVELILIFASAFQSEPRRISRCSRRMSSSRNSMSTTITRMDAKPLTLFGLENVKHQTFRLQPNCPPDGRCLGIWIEEGLEQFPKSKVYCFPLTTSAGRLNPITVLSWQSPQDSPLPWDLICVLRR